MMTRQVAQKDTCLPDDELVVAGEVVDLARGLPSLAHRYMGLPRDVPLADLPVLTKNDFARARTDLVERARGWHEGTILMGSGGTTSSPKLSVLPSSMFLDELIAEWCPVGPGDVVLNVNRGGELGSMFPFFSSFSDRSGAVAVPLGALGDERAVDRWLGFIDEVGVTALAGTPTQLAVIIQRLNETGRRPSRLRSLLWTGEGFAVSSLAEIERYGGLELHGVYGSTETWVVGHSGPRCAVGTFHILPYQRVELLDTAVVVTCLHSACVNPAVRYRVGDQAEVVPCPCGRPGPALRVLGRDDEQIKFLTVLFDPDEPYEAAMSHPSVRRAQVILVDIGTERERMEILVEVDQLTVDTPALEAAIRSTFLDALYRIGHEVQNCSDRLMVRAVERIPPDERTMKTPRVRRVTT